MAGAYNPSLTTDWADGVYTFRLKTGQVTALNAVEPDGPWAAHRKICAGLCTFDLVRAVIFQGLIGGGKAASDAEALCRVWVDGDFPDRARLLAASILEAWFAGAETVPEKKDAAAPMPETAASTPPASTPPVQSSGSRRRRSTTKTSGR